MWGDNHVDFAGGTHALIREIRIALGDDAEAPRFIESIPRQGYRFVAGLDAPARTSPPRADWRIFAVGAASVLVAIAAVALAPAPASPAREATLKGEYLLDRGGGANLKKGAALFEEALALDAGYAPAHAGLAEIAVLRGDFDRAEYEAEKALAADAAHAPAHLHLAMVSALRDWDFARAGSHVDHALTLDVKSAKAWGVKAMLDVIRGRTADAVAAAEKARALDPVSALIRADYGWFHYYAGDFGEAVAACAAARELAPEMAGAHYCEMKAAAASGDIAAASQAAARILALWKAQDALAARLAAFAGADDLAAFYDWQAANARALDGKGEGSKESLAGALAEAGDFDGAADALLAAAKARSPYFPLIARDPLFAPIRDDARVREALALAGLSATARS